MIRKITNTLFALLCFVFVNGISAQQNKIKYQFTGNGVSLTTRPGWNNDIKMPRMRHSDEMDTVTYAEEFNRAIKRGVTILVTGDKPRFAMMHTRAEDKTDPDLVKMGDGKIRVKMGNKEEWLHAGRNCRTVFNPSSTEYNCAISFLPKLKIQLLISQAKDWGIIAKLSLVNTSNAAVNVQAGLLYGGVRKCGRTFTASYFSPDDQEDLATNVIDTIGYVTRLSATNFPGSVYISSLPAIKPGIESSKLSFFRELNLSPGEQKQVYFIMGQAIQNNDSTILKNIREADPDRLIRESREYYEGMLKVYSITTPSKVLDGGFKTAILNFDNIYAAPAWLEGIHWWSAYWTNNYQVSAAIALYQLAKAKTAIEFYNSAKYGPAPIMTAAGKPDIQAKSGEDGLPYYLYSFIQYYNSTGDTHLLSRVWPQLRKSIDLLWRERDKDENGLLNWHMGANAFMYQADHLEMPGDAASPSLMMAGMLEKVAEIGLQLGQTDDAKRWKYLSGRIYASLENILWNKKEGAFFNHKDEQEITHTARYYTDLVFPSLYTQLPRESAWQSLDYLYRTLWTTNYKGEKNLMKVGDFKPSIFGNDNVMPTEMAEAARAYFKEGDNNKGIKLLESVALAGTVFTEAPGNFPERMNDDGKGEANYLFGNPIGSFIYATIRGLFGLELSDQNKTLNWAPAFPGKWDHAGLHLPYAEISYKKSIAGVNAKLIYGVRQNESRKLNFSLYLEPCKGVTVYCNGKKIHYTLSAALEKIKIEFSAEAAIRHSISIQYQPVKINLSFTQSLYPGAHLSLKINTGIEKISDPQHVFSDYNTRGNTLKGTISEDTGHHVFFIQSKQVAVLYPVHIYNKPLYTISCNTGAYNFDKHTLFMKLKGCTPSLKEKSILHVKFLGHEKDIVLKEAENTLSYPFEISGMDLIPGGTYNVEYSIQKGAEILFKGKESVLIKGKDEKSLVEMDKLKSSQTGLLDISNLYNTNRLFTASRWRYEYLLMDSNYFSTIDEPSKNIFKSFGYLAGRPATIAMINNGISDAYTCETKHNGAPSQMIFPVNKKSLMLSLLWVNEIQSRQTNTTVGTIELLYSDGEKSVIPLVVGQNLDASWKYFARDLVPVKMKGEDYAKIYTVPCNPEKTLESFTISLKASDVQIGVAGVKIIRPKEKLPVIGAIRWDGWYYDNKNDYVTAIVAKTMAPKEFHDRLPFFAKEISDDSVYIDGSSQAVMDKEIAWAKAGGLDYWAFVTYPEHSGLAIGMKNYLHSTHRRDINFCLVTEQARINPSDTSYLNYIIRLLKEPGYQRVANGRPLWYLGFIDSASVIKAWGSFHNLKLKLDSMRASIVEAGFENPFLVIMDFKPELGKRWSDSLGGNAISSYATSKNSIKGSYKKLSEETAQFWEECKATGSQVIPLCMAGWSPKPRLDYPNIWSHFYPKDVYYSNATPAELAAHIKDGLTWLQNNRASAETQCALIYAWNEYDEGGWLGPMLHEGSARLEALARTIKAFKNKSH